jgi:ferredoxin-NADP reductase
MTAGALASTDSHDRWLAMDRATRWEEAEVTGVDRNGGGTRLRLRLDQVPQVLPGQYYLVRLAVSTPPGVVEQAYSLCSSPYPPSTEIEIAVRAVPRGRVSPALARQVEVGDRLQVRGPYGFLTWTEADGGPIGLIGAGTGVAPLAAIVRYAAARQLEVPMTLLCSSRDRGTALLGDELSDLTRRVSWFRLVRTFTRSPHDDSATYHRRIDTAMLAEVFGDQGRTARPIGYYVAGPAGMVIATRAMLGSLGVADELISSEDHA